MGFLISVGLYFVFLASARYLFNYLILNRTNKIKLKELRNQKKNKSSHEIDKDLSYRDERKSVSPPQDKKVAESVVNAHGMFGGMDFDSSNLSYIN